jgi:hypothetical protein
MEFYCDQFWFCNAMPPEWHWVMPLGMPLLLIIIVAVPVANILYRAGRSRWWTILAFVPLVNLIGLWVFAFTRRGRSGRPDVLWTKLAGLVPARRRVCRQDTARGKAS